MFISIAVVFIFCGIFLLVKAKKISKNQGLYIVINLCAIAFVALGVVLSYAVLFGKIVLPLH